MTDYKTDVAIIGAGIAGITAAIELLNAGKNVLLLDRDKEKNFGGLAKESFGVFFVVDSPEQRRAGIKDSPELAFNDWCNYGKLSASDGFAYQWAQFYVEHSRTRIYDWLKTKGLRFVPALLLAERGLTGNGNSVPRHHLTWGTGFEVSRVLTDILRTHPNRDKLTLAFEHRVDDLESTNQKITGCYGVNEVSGEEFMVSSDAVIIAAGGTNGNDDKIKKNWHSDWGKIPPDTVLNGSHQYAQGMMHDAVQQSGGNLINMDRSWNYAAGIPHPTPHKPRHGLSLVPCPSALWMDAEGRRIGPDPLVPGFDTRHLISRICQVAEQKNLPKYSWQVMNREIMLKEFAISGSEYNGAIKEKRMFSMLKELISGDTTLIDSITKDSDAIVTASTVEELGRKMRKMSGSVAIDIAGMASDIAAYDATIDRGAQYFNDIQLHRITQLRAYAPQRARTAKFKKINTQKSAPLYAIRLNIISRKSLGGIQTNLASQVLRVDGSIIDGLYAAGESAGSGGGGVHGIRTLESTFLGGAILTGRAAADAIISGQ